MVHTPQTNSQRVREYRQKQRTRLLELEKENGELRTEVSRLTRENNELHTQVEYLRNDLDRVQRKR